jgi:hypothetical protein
MTLEEIKNLSNTELLDLYSLYVEIHHYVPFETPEKIKILYKNKISVDDLYEILLDRLEKRNEQKRNH